MTKFEEFILTNFIPKHSKINASGKDEIELESVLELNLEPKQKEFLFKTLKDYQIEIAQPKPVIVEEKITQEDRSPLVRDFDYGAVSSVDNKKNDVPIHSEIEYDQMDTPIFENYTELEVFLDKEFIPKTIKTKRFKDNTTGDIEFYSSIQLNQITKLKLSEQEVKHTIEFLESRDIRVAGINSTLDSEFDNYDYITTHKTQHLPETATWEEQLVWFQEYNKTKDPNIKQKIVEANLRLVSFITHKITYTYKVDIHELNSYGYERLIEVIDSFDLSMGNKFSTFAFIAVSRYIYRRLPSILGFRNLNVYKDFVTATEAIKDLYAEQGIEEEIAVSEITELIRNVNNYGRRKTQNVHREIAMGNMENIEDLADNEDYTDDYTLHRGLLEFESQKYLMEVLDTITAREKFVLVQRFGLEDGEIKTFEHVGKMLNVTRERVRQIEAQALRKLRHPSRAKNLRILLDGYDELNYDETVNFKRM